MLNKALVAYFTKGGASEEYAKVIAETLKANGLAVEIRNLENGIPDISTFDIVALGTGVRMGIVYRCWRKVLKQNTLRDKHLFLFLSSGTAINDPDAAVEKFLRPLEAKYNLKSISLISFPGKIPEKWAKLDGEKVTFKPAMAREWAQKIANQVQKNAA